MADTKPKTSSDGVEHWKSINFYWSLIMYITRNVLRIFFSITACIMFQISSWLKIVSDYLKTTEKAENLPEKTIENRCNVNSFSNHTNENEELKEVFKVINDTDNELIDKECNLYSNCIDKNEEQKEANKVIGGIVNGLIDNVIKKCDDYFTSNKIDKNLKTKQFYKVIDEIIDDMVNELIEELIDKIIKECNGESVLDHNIVTEQQTVNGVITNIANCKLNEESDSQYYEVEQKPKLQIPRESRENSNPENSLGKVKEEIITCEDIGSARVRKKHPIKNTAMLLITKTMNENKLKDKQFKFENKLNKDKMLNKETPYGNPYRDKDKNCSNKSDSFKRETKFAINNESEKTDCFEVVNNIYHKDISIDSGSKCNNDNKILDMHTNIELTENQWKIYGNEKLITKNNVDHCEMDNGTESRNPITKAQNIINEINGEHLINYNGHENKNPTTKTENVITKKNDVYWKDFEDFDNSKPNSKTGHMTTKNSGECWEDNDKPITKTENKMLNLFEVEDDIFDLPSKFSLAHCICEDFHNSMSMTADFKYKFGKIGALMDQHLRVSDVGHIIHNDQHIFYLVIKRKVTQKPLLSSLEIALYNLRDKMNDLKLTKLAIPKYGLDTFNMIEVKKLISKIFKLSNIEVTLCLSSPKLDIQHFNPPKVNFTYKHLWEMEKQTDIILFIDINTVYSENWNDEVVERINNKYPFKEKLLNDINVKPMAHGDLLVYKIDSEVLFCLFIKPFDQNSTYYRSLEKAFQDMKSQLTGYRYLGIQQEPISYKPYQYNLPRTLYMLKSVFSVQNAEIWVCGDTEQHKAYNYQQYKKIVNDVIELNQKRNSKPNSKSKNRLERKRHGANINNTKHDLTEKHYTKNTSDVNTVTYLNREPICVDNYITENWDN